MKSNQPKTFQKLDLMKYLKNPRIYLIIIVLVFVLHALHFNFFVCDDSFISYRYAKNFINGHGLVWNVGEQPPVEGYTNFLWVIVISLFMKRGFEPVMVSKVLGVSFGLCCILLTYLFSELILQRKSLLNLIAPSVLAICGPFAAWSVEGLETQMFTFLTLTAGIAYLYEIQHDRSIPLSAILFALASLTRPEGLLIFGLTSLHYFSHLLLFKKNPFCRKSIVWFFTFLIIYGIYFFWRFNYYGFFLPNTFYAKTGGGLYQIWRGLRYLVRFIVYNKWPLLLGLSLLSLLKSSRFTLGYLLLLTISYSCYIVVIGGDCFAMFRFFVPILPAMAILAQEEVISFGQWLQSLRYPRPAKIYVTIFCSFIFFILAMGVKPFFRGPERMRYFYHQRVTQRLTAEGKWLRKHASPNDTVAAIGVGAISYYSGLHIIDRLGITDIHVAHTKMPHMGKGFPGHEKRNFKYILSRKPTYFLGPLTYPKDSKYFKPSEDDIKKFYQLYEPFQINETNLKVSLHKLKDELKD